MKTLHILEIGSGNEAHAVRAAAECWGTAVTVTWCGNSSQIVDYLSSRPPHDVIVISGHGDSSGLVLPELHESVRHKYPYDQRISPEQFREFVDLNGATVVNLSCESGREAFGDAFVACGASWYIGPAGSPDGPAALMYLLELLYGFLVSDAPVPDAHRMATSHSDDRSLFGIYGVDRDR